MTIALQKTHLRGQRLYRNLEPCKKRRLRKEIVYSLQLFITQYQSIISELQKIFKQQKKMAPGNLQGRNPRNSQGRNPRSSRPAHLNKISK